jgi:hypothetical protein
MTARGDERDALPDRGDYLPARAAPVFTADANVINKIFI